LEGGAKSKPILGPHLVCGFLTTSPNAVVQPDPKAMPVILTADEERDVRMRARGDEAKPLQRHAARTRPQDRHAARGQRRQNRGMTHRNPMLGF
jgi:putative SOS response-associated peptidase YedK